MQGRDSTMQTCVIPPTLKELCQFVFSQECGYSFVYGMLQTVQYKDQKLGILKNLHF